MIAAGGTAGHIYPALAVAEYLQNAGHELTFAGSPEGMEARLLADTDIAYVAFAARGFSRQHPLSLLSSAALLARSSRQARRWLRTYAPQAVASFGGYVSVPVGQAASELHIPLLVHEQNSSLGLANRHLAGRAQVLALTYQAAAAGFAGKRHAPTCIAQTGTPVRAEFTSLADVSHANRLRCQLRANLGISQEATLLLVFGGSQGARHINSTLSALAQRLLTNPQLAVLHSTGTRDFATVRAKLNTHLSQAEASRWHLIDYCTQMPAALAAADLIVARAGASSLAEIAAARRPALLVPYPYATNNHQEHNAAALVAAGAAVMVLDRDLDTPLFVEQLEALLADTERRECMAQAATLLPSQDATAEVARLLCEIAL